MGYQHKTARRFSKETKAKMREAKLRLYADPEVRARKSAAMKAAMADPEVRARHAAAMKAAMADPEVRARHAAAMKAAMDCLTDDQVGDVIKELQKKPQRRYIDIAEDWLVSEGTIARIAREAGVQRRPRVRGRRPLERAGASAT